MSSKITPVMRSEYGELEREILSLYRLVVKYQLSTVREEFNNEKLLIAAKVIEESINKIAEAYKNSSTRGYQKSATEIPAQGAGVRPSNMDIKRYELYDLNSVEIFVQYLKRCVKGDETYSYIAKHTGLSSSHLSQIFAGNVYMTIDSLIRLVDYFGYEVVIEKK